MSSFDTEFTLDIQKKFLQLLIFDQKWAALNGLDIIKPEFFENRILHNLCKWIHEYYKKYKNIPTKDVLKEKAKDFINTNTLGTKEYFQYAEIIDHIFNLDDNTDLEFFKDKAIVFVRQAAWQQVLAKGSETLKEGNYEEAINAFKKVLTLGSENDLGLDFEDTTTEKFLDLLKEDYDKGSMLQTGIPGWDKALGGGFVKKNLHLIGACFPGNVKITTNKGNKSFEELEKLTDYSDLEIYSFDKNNQKIKNKIRNVFKTKQVTQLVYLKLNNGKSIYCTPDHYFVIKNPKKEDVHVLYENGIAYKQAQYLEETDEL